MYRYPRAYFDAFSAGSARSAEIVLPIVNRFFKISSVADFGCGTGAWLAVWNRLGVHDIVGCDGPYVDSKEQLGGYYIIDVPDLDAALAWAARCPGAFHGVVEVRPFWDEVE